MKTVVQISLDLTDLDQAIETAKLALDAGVDWLEAGTPLILAEGLRAVRGLRERFPGVPIVADLKTMDGGYLEAEMMAKGGSDPRCCDGSSSRRNHQVRREGRTRFRDRCHG